MSHQFFRPTYQTGSNPPSYNCFQCNRPVTASQSLCDSCIFLPRINQNPLLNVGSNSYSVPGPSRMAPYSHALFAYPYTSNPYAAQGTPLGPPYGQSQVPSSYPRQDDVNRISKMKSDRRERFHQRSSSAPYPKYQVSNNQNSNSSSQNFSIIKPASFEYIKSTTPLPSTSIKPEPSCDTKLSSESKSTEFLAKEIKEYFHEHKQSRELYERKMSLRSKLHEILRMRFRGCNLYIVGSSQNFLGSNKSDLDLCLTLDMPTGEVRNLTKKYLYQMRRLFSQRSFIKNIEVILAKVPILRCFDSIRNIEVDININNTIGIRNTQLLSTYAFVDERCCPLITIVKAWAKTHDINDAKNGTLSSYCIALMVIHYLQYRCRPPVLPSLQLLQPDKYLQNANVHKLKFPEDLPHFKSENKQDLGELFIGFLNYYANEFNFQENAISVRLGKVIPQENSLPNGASNNIMINMLSQGRQWKFLYVEEPFEQTNVARAVTTAESFNYIRYVFEFSHRNLSHNPALISILG